MSTQNTKSQNQPAEKKPKRRRGIFGTIFSHLMVAAFAVLAVSTYMHWVDILTYTSSKVCAYNVLGKYAPADAKSARQTSPDPKVPPIDLSKPAAKADKPPEQPAKETSQTDSNPAPPPASETKSDLDTAWQAARKMFWDKDPATAKAYEKLIADFPEKAELRAELGNVYFKSGKRDQAVEMYLSAGKLFSAQENTAKAVEMKKILEKLAPEKAAELPDSDKKPVQ